MRRNRRTQLIFAAAILAAALEVGATVPPICQSENPPAITLHPLGTYANGWFDVSASIDVTHDPQTQRLFVTNRWEQVIDVIDVANPAQPFRIATIDPSLHGSEPKAVDCRDGSLAVVLDGHVVTEPGNLVFYDTQSLLETALVEVGVMPDMVGFSPDGRYVVVANEGEPKLGVDPEGSVSIVDVSAGVAGLTQADVRSVGFAGFTAAQVESMGVRIIGTNATAEQDLEPEFAAFSPDSTTAWIALQENNAIAEIDLDSATVSDLIPLGSMDYMLAGNALDASDRDNAINITNWPVRGLYQPDEIAVYEVAGQTYWVLPNEGDRHDPEAVRVKNLVLDPTAFPNASALRLDGALGRLQVTHADGDTDGDGDYDKLFVFGTRSFSIRTPDGTIVYDSRDDFEQITAARFPDGFNANDDENGADRRSDNRGPEPESISLASIFGGTFVFIGLERTGGIMVYDVSDPQNASFVDYVTTRDFSGNPAAGTAGDLGPEGMTFIAAADSPSGAPLLVVSHEISGTTTVFEVVDCSAEQDDDDDGWPNDSDNCPDVFNPSQSDQDGDLIGDHCDCDPSPAAIGSSMVLSKVAGATEIDWLPLPGVSHYNVYRGTRDIGAAFAYNHQCLTSVNDSMAMTNVGPAPQRTFYYLVTAQCPIDETESSLGTDSAGAPRPLPDTCP